MDIGTKLREARLQRNLTIRELAEATKIRVELLESIERNDFSRLPGGLFTRGHLRAYARQVGLDAESLIQEHLVQSEPSRQRPYSWKPARLFGDERRSWLSTAD